MVKWQHLHTNEIIQIDLLVNNVKSLAKIQHHNEKWELCVADWSSTDVDDVNKTLTSITSTAAGEFECKVATIDNNRGFDRGYSRNVAASLATHDNLFFIDADMFMLDRSVINDAYKYMSENKAYFPICSSYADRKHTRRFERSSGCGNVAITRRLFNTKPGGWLCKDSWGGEDDDMLKFFNEHSIRNYHTSFIHQWHPQDVSAWGNRIEGYKQWKLLHD